MWNFQHLTLFENYFCYTLIQRTQKPTSYNNKLKGNSKNNILYFNTNCDLIKVVQFF